MAVFGHMWRNFAISQFPTQLIEFARFPDSHEKSTGHLSPPFR